jgi:polar amino acid transport system substrate-binding protein
MLLVLVSLLLVTLSVSADDKTVVAAADPWPPFVDQNNPKDGLSLEIIRAAMQTQGYTVKMAYVPWARALAGVTDATYDILPDAWMTEERKATLSFSGPYTSNDILFIKKKGDPFEYKGLDSLKSKTVGVITGYGYGDAFMNSSLFKREGAGDLLTNIRKVVAGHIDLTLEDQIVAKSLISKADPSLLDQIEFTKNSLSTNALYIAVGLQNPRQKEIIAAFNKGLAIIKSNGTFEKLLESYGIK